MPRDRCTIEDLRRVIDRLPVRTRAAMLEGVHANDIIAGATERELPVLERHLAASLAADAHRGDAGPVDLRSAITEHQSATRARRTREAAQTGAWGFPSYPIPDSGPPPGCRNWISGTTQPGEVLSR